MSINYNSSPLKSTSESPLAYSKKLSGKEFEGPSFSQILKSDLMISRKEIENNKKKSELADSKRMMHGTNIDSFFVDYAEIRNTDTADSLAEAAKALGVHTDNQTLSQTNGTSDADADDIADIEKSSAEQLADGYSKKYTGMSSDGIPCIFFKYRDEIDFSRILNENSTGDAELTADQIAALKSKYNMSNLSPQEQYDLFCDLTDMNILTVEDVSMMGMSIYIPKPGLIQVSSGEEDRFPDWLFGELSPNERPQNIYECILQMIDREQNDYNYMLSVGEEVERYGDMLPIADPVEQMNYQNRKEAYEQFEQMRESVDYIMGSHKKVADVLSLLFS